MTKDQIDKLIYELNRLGTDFEKGADGGWYRILPAKQAAELIDKYVNDPREKSVPAVGRLDVNGEIEMVFLYEPYPGTVPAIAVDEVFGKFVYQEKSNETAG